MTKDEIKQGLEFAKAWESVVQNRVKEIEKARAELEAIKAKVTEETAELARVGCTQVASRVLRVENSTEQNAYSNLDFSVYAPKATPPEKFDPARTFDGK